MEPPKTTPKPFWPLLWGLSIIAFILGSALFLYTAKARYLELGNMAQSHLTYALQLKDDMAVIDWSKALEHSPSVAVFQTKGPGGNLVQGGNQNLFPSFTTDGMTYHFPFQWNFHSSLKSNSNSYELTIVFQDQLSCLSWGMFSFLMTLITGLILNSVRPRQHFVDRSTLEPHPQMAVQETPPPPVFTPIEEQALIINLDKDYIICQATAGAAQALGKDLPQLLNSHFLDLLPDPSVMKAINQGRETELLKPFPALPHLSASLKPIPNGFAIYLQTPDDLKKA